ncbi:PKD domain-containing protein [Methanolobus sp. WCC4]|uniref:PKD domain-containing protein n=1 Tax=Methanolobus sp. WCC4 TaxID=3125784 RepID=UPI0030F88C3D
MGTATAETITVDDDIGSAEYTSIQAAINASSPGDTILVYPGNYIENVDVNKQLTITSTDGASVTNISGPIYYDGILPYDDHVIDITADQVTISGFTVSMVGLQKSCIFLNGSSYSTIENNEIIISNYYYAGGYGINLESSSNNELVGNTITASGLRMGWEDPYSTGIRLYTSNDSIIISNTIMDCTYAGFELYNSGNNKLTDNTIVNNVCGIYFYEYVYNNKIYNNFFNNSDNLANVDYLDTNLWDTEIIDGPNIIGGPYIAGNYWAKLDGTGFSQTHTTDANGDGICDNPYVINEKNIDHFPLILQTNQAPVANEDEIYFEFTSNLDLETANGVTVVDNYAYLAANNGLVIVNVNDQTEPTIVGTCITGGETTDVEVIGNYAYVTDLYEGLFIINVNDPTTPTIVGTCYTDGYASDIAIVDNSAYICNVYGLVIVDISNPENPLLIDYCETEGLAGDVVISGNYAFLADGLTCLESFKIIDISNPPSFPYTGLYLVNPGVWSFGAIELAKSGDYVYLVDWVNNKLIVVNVSDPTAPIMEGLYNASGNDIVVKDNYIYLVTKEANLIVLNIDDPIAPTFAGSYSYPTSLEYDSGQSVCIYGNYAYMTCEYDGLIILRINPPLVPNNSPSAIISPIDLDYEGSPVTFNASESYDPDDNPLTYKWDFDNDGTCDFESESPYATHTWDDDYSGDVKLEVSDGILTSTDTITVTVGNVAPNITSFEVQQTEPVEIGTEIDLSCTFTDMGLGDTHDCIIDWGDGTATELLSVTSPVSSSHVYSTSGVYTVNLTIEDDDTGYDTEKYQYVVVYDPEEGFVSGELNCPAHLYAYDLEERYTGFYGSVILEEIPNSFYNGPEYDPEKIIILGQSDTIVYVVDSYDEGTFDLKLKQSNPEGLIEVEYLNVELDEDTTATISVNSETNDFSMLIDMDNNGEIDIIKELDSVAINGNIVNAPTAVISSFEPDTAYEGSPVTFNASESYDPDDDPLTYKWDFNNNGTWDFESESPYATHTWDDDYTGDVKLEVSDGILTSTDTITVTVGNVAPVVGFIDVPINPVVLGTDVTVSASFEDDGTEDTHMPVWNWGDGNYSSDEVFKDRSGEVSDTYTYDQPGVYTITLEVEDDDGGSGTRISEQYVVVYDPDGGFVTGGGWLSSPEGAYVTDPTLTGKATFGFVSKFKKGATIPTGSTEFQFRVADLNFKSTTYDWLVIASSKAMYKGTGTINDEGNYGFMISAVDAELTSSTGIDLFRMKIWDIDDDGTIVYDNMVAYEENVDLTSLIEKPEIGGGSIKIHNGE